MSQTEVAVVEKPSAEVTEWRPVQEVCRMLQIIQEVTKSVMVDGQDYGKIEGCGDKPTLLKPGAEKLAVTFRLEALPETTIIDLGEGHREYRVETTVTHIPTGRRFGKGVGSCSTKETKYRYRQADRKCPKCGKPAIIKGKQEFGGGWLCFAKKGGCGAKFADDAPEIVGQQIGRVENPDIADTYNTVWKMAVKRSMVDAILRTTAASGVFTQDIEDMQDMLRQTATITAAPSTGEVRSPEPEKPAKKNGKKPEPPAHGNEMPPEPESMGDWRGVVCHVGKEDGRCKGKKLGDLYRADLDLLFEKFQPKPDRHGIWLEADRVLWWAVRRGIETISKEQMEAKAKAGKGGAV